MQMMDDCISFPLEAQVIFKLSFNFLMWITWQVRILVPSRGIVKKDYMADSNASLPLFTFYNYF